MVQLKEPAEQVTCTACVTQGAAAKLHLEFRVGNEFVVGKALTIKYIFNFETSIENCFK